MYNPNDILTQVSDGSVKVIPKPNMDETGLNPDNSYIPRNLFDVNDFIQDVTNNSRNKNQSMSLASTNINSYDIAHNCIRIPFFKINNYPVPDYKDNWLPVIMRTKLGHAVHDFIQESYHSFTEQEISMKVPSIRASARLDCMIGKNVLVEIKSCTYADYATILRQRKPRDPDFFQTVFYKYLLENHLDECKQQTNTRTPPPAQDNYDIKYIQFIYVAHELMAADCGSISECIEVSKKVKQMLSSKHNHFQYITAITIDLNTIDITPHMDYIIKKLESTNYYLNNNIVPPMTDPFINSKSCHFCLYKHICKQYGGPAK